MNKESIQAITEHYQKTFEVTDELWKERNRLFVFLAIASGIGLLLLLPLPEVSRLLVDAIAKLLGITDPVRVNQLYADFPLDILLSILLVIVFYLMQKLNSTNLSVLRNYLYLGAMEGEIRQNLGLPKESVSFTREGSFYWGRRSPMQAMSKWYYILVLLIVLLPFLTLKIIRDFSPLNIIMIIVDGIVIVFTLLYFIDYARSAVKMDAPKMPRPTSK
jgi:hypothetical protein